VLPVVALAGLLYFIAVMLSEPVLRQEYSLLSHPISDFAVGEYGYLQSSALFALGGALLVLDVSLWRSVAMTPWSRAGLVALTICGFASFGTGIWPADVAGSVAQTTAGAIHAVAAYAGYCSLAAAIVLLSLQFRRDGPWRRLFVPSLVLATLGVVTLVFAAWTARTGIRGLSQRVMAVPLLLWLLATATRAEMVLAARCRGGGRSDDPR
jgi:glucan phosphoethanolaminetransferase (alkaline phosphatase superfamily)